jgi:hypothetical protein
MAEGVCGSETFRTLVDVIRHSNVIVYVSMRPIRDRGVNGRLDFLAATATDRVLRAVFGFPLDRQTRIAVLGHELQHAVEVAATPDIRTAQSFAAHFRAHGRPSGVDRYETAAARAAELRIRQELAQRGKVACVEGIDLDLRWGARGPFWRFEEHRHAAKPRIVDDSAEPVEPDVPLADVLVPVDAARERTLRVVHVPDAQALEPDDALELRDGGIVAFLRRDVVAGREQMARVETHAEPLVIVRLREE